MPANGTSWTWSIAALWTHLVMTPLAWSPNAQAIRFAEAMTAWVEDWEADVPWDFQSRQYRFDRFNETWKPPLHTPAPLRPGKRPVWTPGEIESLLVLNLEISPPNRRTLLRGLDWLCERGPVRRVPRGRRSVYRWVRRFRKRELDDLAEEFPRLPERLVRSCLLCLEGWKHETCADRAFQEGVPYPFPWDPLAPPL